MPSARRISEPVRIGVPTRRPNSVSLRLSCCLIWTPMMAKMVQTAKHTVNAMVDIHKARLWPGVVVATDVVMMSPVSKTDGARKPYFTRVIFEFDQLHLRTLEFN